MKKAILFLIIVLLACNDVYSQNFSKDSISFRIGLHGRAIMNLHMTDFSELPEWPQQNPLYEAVKYSSASGISYNLGISADYILNKNSFIQLALSYSPASADFERTYLTKIAALDGQGSTVLADLNQKQEFKPTFNMLEINANYAFSAIDGLFIHIGPGIALLSGGDYDKHDQILSPQGYSYLDGSVSKDSSGSINDLNSLLFGLAIGVSYEIPLDERSNFVLVFDVSNSLYFNDIVKNLSWKYNGLKAGMGIKYAFNYRAEEKALKDSVKESKPEITEPEKEIIAEKEKEAEAEKEIKENIIAENKCPEGFIKNEAGTCVCPEGFEEFGGKCVEICPEGMIRMPDGSCDYPPCPGLRERDANGDCVCQEGLEEYKGKCVEPCPEGMIRNEFGQCECPEGMELFNGQCYDPCPEGMERNEAGECVYPACPDGKIRNDAGICICPDGLEEFNGQCLEPCPEGQVRNTLGECVLPDCPDGKIRDKDDNCVCPEGMEEINGKCFELCPEGQVRDEYGNCVYPPCPEGMFRDEAGECVWPPCPEGKIRAANGDCICPDGMEEFNGTCMEFCPPGMSRNDAGECVWPPCPEGMDRNEAGECVYPACPDGYERIDGDCYPICPEGMERDIKGDCQCKESFELFNDECVPVCEEGRVRLNDGSCGCPEGFEENADNKCVPIMLKPDIPREPVVEWVKPASIPSEEYSVSQVDQYSMFLSGSFSGEGPNDIRSIGEKDIFVIKYSSDGMSSSYYDVFGGEEDDVLNDSEHSSNYATLFLTGSFMSPAYFGNHDAVGDNSSEEGDIYLACITKSARPNWVQVAYGKGANEGKDITIDRDKNIYITGTFTEAIKFKQDGAVIDSLPENPEYWKSMENDKSMIFIAKYGEKRGELLWSRSIGLPSYNSDANGIAYDNKGNIVLTGSFDNKIKFGDQFNIRGLNINNAFVAQLNSTDGSTRWIKQITGNNKDRGVSVAADPIGNIFVAGQTYSDILIFESTDRASEVKHEKIAKGDIFLAKYNNNGRLIWAKVYGGKGNDAPTDILINKYGDAYLVGEFEESIKLGETTLESRGEKDIFILRVDGTNGYPKWAINAGGKSEDRAGNISVDENGELFIVGYSEGKEGNEVEVEGKKASGENFIFISKIKEEAK